MRDLAARLREVVRRDRQAAGEIAPVPAAPAAAPPARELVYVPDPDAARPRGDVPRALGGTALDGGACVVLEHCYPADRSHGRRRVEAYAPALDAPLHLFDARAAQAPEWWRRVVFFDIETTGLSGGAGTLAFLVGCGWFTESGFTVRQFFLAAPSGEGTMLDALAEIFAGSSLLVTYNGRTFDVPLMETRWAFHRRRSPADDLAHFDMLPAARRLWGRDQARSRGERRAVPPAWPAAAAEDESSCRLSALERNVLGFHRLHDVPGFEVPMRYFHFLRTGDASAVEGVIEHNRHDLMSLAAVMSHALWLAREGPEACRQPGERLAIGRLYERAGQTDAARRAFLMAADSDDAGVKRHALARLAILLRRQGQHDQAAAAWTGVLDEAGQARRPLLPVERRAAEALAIHHEHRARDLRAARAYAALLERYGSSSRTTRHVEHRLSRLDRKIQAGRNRKESGRAVPLLKEE